MGFFRARIGGHKAEVSNHSKASKDRLVNRVGSVKRALEGYMPEPKRQHLKDELRSILLELDAREEAVNAIMAQFED